MNPEFFKKLHLDGPERVLVLNAPQGYVEAMTASLGVKPDTQAKPQPDYYDFVQLFAHNQAELDTYCAIGAVAIKEKGIFWCSYPKLSGPLASDISRDKGWAVLDREGWQGVAQVSLDDTWSCIRFRKQSQSKVNPRTREARVIQAKSNKAVPRQVQVPADMLDALQAKPEAWAVFDKWAYTHRKEYVNWVIDAKRDDTRQRRISKAVELISQGKKFS